MIEEKESRVIDDSFLCIRGWMVNRLNLCRNAVTIFATIYGLNENGRYWFDGSQQYLADWCQCSRKAVSDYLKELVSLELLIKEKKGNNCRYRYNKEKVDELRYGKSMKHCESINSNCNNRYY